MARRYRHLRDLKSIAGAAIIGLGLLILFGNLVDAAARLSRLTGISADTVQTFGEMIGVVLAASHVVQSYLFDRGELLRGLGGILISFWPLLLVGAGMFLAGTTSRAESRNYPKKYTGDVDLTVARSTRQ